MSSGSNQRERIKTWQGLFHSLFFYTINTERSFISVANQYLIINNLTYNITNNTQIRHFLAFSVKMKKDKN